MSAMLGCALREDLSGEVFTIDLDLLRRGVTLKFLTG